LLSFQPLGAFKLAVSWHGVGRISIAPEHPPNAPQLQVLVTVFETAGSVLEPQVAHWSLLTGTLPSILAGVSLLLEQRQVWF
jgi:hypothetical protein